MTTIPLDWYSNNGAPGWECINGLITREAQRAARVGYGEVGELTGSFGAISRNLFNPMSTWREFTGWTSRIQRPHLRAGGIQSVRVLLSGMSVLRKNECGNSMGVCTCASGRIPADNIWAYEPERSVGLLLIFNVTKTSEYDSPSHGLIITFRGLRALGIRTAAWCE